MRACCPSACAHDLLLLQWRRSCHRWRMGQGRLANSGNQFNAGLAVPERGCHHIGCSKAGSGLPRGIIRGAFAAEDRSVDRKGNQSGTAWLVGRESIKVRSASRDRDGHRQRKDKERKAGTGRDKKAAPSPSRLRWRK